MVFHYARVDVLQRGEILLIDLEKPCREYPVVEDGDIALGDWRETPAVRSIHSRVENRLCEGFAELDCQTGDVVVRQQLYATLVHRAICMARQRLPGNRFLDDLISASSTAAGNPISAGCDQTISDARFGQQQAGI